MRKCRGYSDARRCVRILLITKKVGPISSSWLRPFARSKWEENNKTYCSARSSVASPLIAASGQQKFYFKVFVIEK